MKKANETKNEKKIEEVEIGEVIILTNTDSGDTCVAALSSDGCSGGTNYDLWMRYISDVLDSDYELYPHVTTSQDEADEFEISL